MRRRKPYRIVGAYDSETTNLVEDGMVTAFPVLHQLGILDGTPIGEVDSANVERVTSIELYRHSVDLYGRLDSIVSSSRDYVPVILCHNLSFDMYGLSPWLSRHEVRVLAKSARKPISFSIAGDDGKPALVIWDTLVFTQQSLERMGADCGYAKGSGEWDYNLIRTPDTPLSDAEVDYAKRDIFALLAWFGWWVRRNPDIDPSRLGINVVTKTGVVRERRRVRFDQLRGRGQKQNVGRYWLYRNRMEAPSDDDELFTMLACTRGGFTFCAFESASVPYDTTGTDRVVAGYDAVSQHPAQMVSHRYPVGFKEQSPRVLETAFEVVGKVGLNRVLKMWDKPFPVAFNACFEFENLRPREGSPFEWFGILPIASERYRSREQVSQDEENGDRSAYMEHIASRDYRDSCVNPSSLFGKLVSADRARLYLTELAAWEMWQCYTWDSVRAVHGYETGRFSRPSDMDVVSVMQFYQAKNVFKRARSEFYDTGTISDGERLKALGIAPAVVAEMEGGTATATDVEAVYLGLKADVNALFGINASNEYRRDTVLTSNGIEYQGEFGVCNAPENSKVWYQFGQRIVGWSRVAQICVMLLCAPHVDAIVNGDTDSVKLLMRRERLPVVADALSRFSDAVDAGKESVCSRVMRVYPDLYDDLAGVGHYELEMTTQRFCAAWNKAYCEHDGERFSFTIAGIPTRRREGRTQTFIGVNGMADRLYAMGWSYERICNVFLGYNVTYAHDVIRLNSRKFPKWGSLVMTRVEDHTGAVSMVAEPCSLALYPASKTVNSTASPDNRINMAKAVANNPRVNIDGRLICSSGVIDIEGI